MGNPQILGASLIVMGAFSIAGGFYLLTRSSKSLPERSTVLARSDSTSRSTPSLSSEEKGRLFENWIVKKFKPNYFSIKEWRSDKYVDGVYAESSTNPDFQIEFRIRDRKATFAVECKWRKSFEGAPKAGISWATEAQIANYRRFQDDHHVAVFVVLGVGGSPDQPAELYIIPLEKLRYPFASVEYLSKFRRTNPGADFFFDDRRNELR